MGTSPKTSYFRWQVDLDNMSWRVVDLDNMGWPEVDLDVLGGMAI